MYLFWCNTASITLISMFWYKLLLFRFSIETTARFIYHSICWPFCQFAHFLLCLINIVPFKSLFHHIYLAFPSTCLTLSLSVNDFSSIHIFETLNIPYIKMFTIFKLCCIHLYNLNTFFLNLH